MFHLNQPSEFKRSNWIISDEYDLFLGTKSEGSVNFYKALIGIQTGNGINPNNAANVYIGYGTEGPKLTTTGYGVSITGSLSATDSIGIGTTTPTSKLTVVGDVSVSGVVTAISFAGTATSTTNIPNLTGAITSSNTTTSLGSFTSENLDAALTDKTGSGVNVFATSPTLVTPVLGAASASSINVSGIVTATEGFISVGNTTPIQISLIGNQLTFTAFGIGSTTLTLS